MVLTLGEIYGEMGLKFALFRSIDYHFLVALPASAKDTLKLPLYCFLSVSSQCRVCVRWAIDKGTTRKREGMSSRLILPQIVH